MTITEPVAETIAGILCPLLPATSREEILRGAWRNAQALFAYGQLQYPDRASAFQRAYVEVSGALRALELDRRLSVEETIQALTAIIRGLRCMMVQERRWLCGRVGLDSGL